jgi:Transcription factor Tfb4
MNAAFSAQRCGMVLDACVLGAGHSAFLQQVRCSTFDALLLVTGNS